MANSRKFMNQSESNRSQRGQECCRDVTCTLDSVTPFVAVEYDTAQSGGNMFAAVVYAPSANITVKFQVSMDRTNWLDSTCLDEAGAAHGGAEVSITATNREYLVQNYTNNAAHVAMRWWRLLLTNADTTSNAVTVHSIVK